MLDISNGRIEINDNLVISPLFTYEDFTKTPYFKGQNSVMMVYLDDKQIIDGRTYSVGFFFKQKKIYMVTLVNCDEDISQKDEKKRKEIHDRILIQASIKEGKNYGWGKIQSEYDARSNISSINIYYQIGQ